MISRAAPSFPDERVLRPYAERFPAHWLVGTLADLTGASLESVYRVASIAFVAAAVVLTHAAIRTLGLDARAHAVALGLLAASAYPLHYLLAAPGMVSDGLFLAGLAPMLLGFVRGRLALRRSPGSSSRRSAARRPSRSPWWRRSGWPCAPGLAAETHPLRRPRRCRSRTRPTCFCGTSATASPRRTSATSTT